MQYKFNTYLNFVQPAHLIAGVSGGVTSTLMVHPLDLIKIRFAANEGNCADRPNYKGLFHAFQDIYKYEGIYGLYKGAVPNVVGAGVAWGLYFFFYNGFKAYYKETMCKNNLGPAEHLLAGCVAGLNTLIFTNPFFVIKTRLCLQYEGINANKTYTGMLHAFKHITTHEGIIGLYKGFVPGLLGISHGALQFMAYEELKIYYLQLNGTSQDDKLSTFAYLTCAALSKIFAVSITYPYQVVRIRLQDHHRNQRKISNVIKNIWTREGITGYYKGLLPNILRVTPATAVTFVVYENTLKMLI